jgi:hypothetical protein
LLRVCLDLNIWIGAFLAEKANRADTAAQALVSAVREGRSPHGAVALVISYGMIFRLKTVLLRLTGDMAAADRIPTIIAELAEQGPSLTLGGVGVLPMDDHEDRHVLETALAGRADILVTHNLGDFIGGDVRELLPGRWYGATHSAHRLLIAHTYDGAAWIRGDGLPREALAYRGEASS